MRISLRILTFLVLSSLAGLATVYSGCSDSGSPAEPETPAGVVVRLSPEAMEIGITETREFNAVVTGGTANTVDWYVAGVMGGNTTVGTITQGNPATFTAPDGAPVPSMVLVRAVSTDDSTRSDSCQVTVTDSRIYVNATTGHDTNGVGGRNKPYKSITKGLTTAGAGDHVIAAAGVYDDGNGETFPITVPDSVVLEGENWETCVIRVAAEQLNVRNAVVLGCEDCTIRKFTFEEDEISDVYWTIAVSISDATNALADSLRCLERALYSVLRVQRDHGSTVQNCYFVVSDGARSDRGLEIVFNEDGNNSILRNLTVSGFSDGLMFNSIQNTLVENCNLSGNVYGVDMCCYDDVNHKPNPDFGGGARGSLGGNIFSGNSNCGLRNPTANVIYAMYNTWSNIPPVAGVDFCNEDAANGGDVIVQ
jgi:hypothetical protein